jgi:hypothetical protein
VNLAGALVDDDAAPDHLPLSRVHQRENIEAIDGSLRQFRQLSELGVINSPDTSLANRTTQLYFPDEPMNRRDGLFRRELVMRMAEAEGGLAARFDFVLDMR